LFEGRNPLLEEIEALSERLNVAHRQAVQSSQFRDPLGLADASAAGKWRA
jgi:hypothetical protein